MGPGTTYTAVVSDLGAPVPEHDARLAEIVAAAERIRGRVRRTPMLSSRTAGLQLQQSHGMAAGAGPGADGVPRIFLKAEHLQVTGSFKPRGATNCVLTLSSEDRARGIVTVSAGNHAQAVAYAGAAAGIPVTVVMPWDASRAKAEAAGSYGATVILHGRDVGETFGRMEELRAQQGLYFLHPYDDPAVICGQGTVGLEILDDLPGVDVVVVAVGGGGLLAGVAAALKQRRPSVRVYGVEPEHSNALSLGIAAGHPVTIQPHSIADGLGASFAGVWTIDLARRHADGIILVDEPTIAAGMRFGLERMKQLLEPAGATALGALLAGRVPIRDGEVVCAVASGGNVDLDRIPQLLALAAQS